MVEAELQASEAKEITAKMDNMKVRYLTPLECERLMGWPDEYTRYGINDRGEKYEISDNARYNLIGNGVVPQVVRGIIEKVMP